MANKPNGNALANVSPAQAQAINNAETMLAVFAVINDQTDIAISNWKRVAMAMASFNARTAAEMDAAGVPQLDVKRGAN